MNRRGFLAGLIIPFVDRIPQIKRLYKSAKPQIRIVSKLPVETILIVSKLPVGERNALSAYVPGINIVGRKIIL